MNVFGLSVPKPTASVVLYPIHNLSPITIREHTFYIKLKKCNEVKLLKHALVR